MTYDHRGHGQSAAADPATMTIEQLADDLAEVVAATAPEGPLVFGGHSMGGMTLMALAQRHPAIVHRAAGIALVSTASGGLGHATLALAPWQAAALRRVERRVYGSRRWAARRTLGSPVLLGPAMRWLLLGEDPSREAWRLTAGSVAACCPRTISGFRPTLDAHERHTALAAFAETPTVVCVGSLDRLTPVRAARRIAAAIPAAELTVFPGAGHILPLERAGEVTDRISALARSAVLAGR